MKHLLQSFYWKKWRTQNFNFLSWKSSSPCQVWGAPIHADIIELSSFLLQLKNQREQKCMCFFHCFYFEMKCNVLKSKSPCFLLKKKKNVKFNQNKMESKMENPTHNFREMKEKKVFLVMLILSEGSFCNIRVLSQSIVYYLNFQYILLHIKKHYLTNFCTYI